MQGRRDSYSRAPKCRVTSLRTEARSLTAKKSGPIAGATVQKRQWKESQERRCKGPIRLPDRLNVRCRERRVKVKRGLFSYLLEEHLPSQKPSSQTQCPRLHTSHCKHTACIDSWTFWQPQSQGNVWVKKMHIPAHWLQRTNQLEVEIGPWSRLGAARDRA